MEPINCSLSSGEDQYISLSVSRDSDEQFANSVKHVKQKVSA
jgi:hypothetical protein